MQIYIKFTPHVLKGSRPCRQPQNKKKHKHWIIDVSYLLTQPTFMGTLLTVFYTIFYANTPNISV